MSKETVAADDRQRGFLKRLFKWQTTGAVSAVTEEVDGHGHPEESLFSRISKFLARLLGVLALLVAVLTGAWMGGVFFERATKPRAAGIATQEDWTRLPSWTRSADASFLQAADDAARAFSGSRFDQLALGLHHFDANKRNSYFYFMMAAARGSYTARLRLTDGGWEQEIKDFGQTDFVKAMTNGGRDGNFLLGMLYLQDHAFKLAHTPKNRYCWRDEKIRRVANDSSPNQLTDVKPNWPPCEKDIQLFGASQLIFPNNLIPRNDDAAYSAFARASQCFHEEASRWMTAMQKDGLITNQRARALQIAAQKAVLDGGPAYCQGIVIKIPEPEPQRPNVETGAKADEGAKVAALKYCSLEPKDGVSKAQRERPGRSGYSPAQDAASSPICTDAEDGAGRADYCQDSLDALAASDEARVCLRLGDAVLSAGDVDFALQYYRAAIARGRQYGAQASIVAGDRLRALSITCEYSTASLARIARGTTGDRIIDLEHRQRALAALGHYSGRVDGKYGAQTRDAVRGFQREIGFDETGALSALETVLLICQAAEAKSDRDSQNVLGIMYAAGLGVVQNTDLSLEWFERASRRGSAEAAYNLARIFATGTILSSYRLCDIVENDERARAYWEDARALEHPEAEKETFDQFKTRVQGEIATGLERVGRSCGPAPRDQNDGQNE